MPREWPQMQVGIGAFRGLSPVHVFSLGANTAVRLHLAPMTYQDIRFSAYIDDAKLLNVNPPPSAPPCSRSPVRPDRWTDPCFQELRRGPHPTSKHVRSLFLIF